MSKGMISKAAFTLIELLVVIAIIGLLAAILMPALGNARRLAQEKACLSNLHNIGMALQIYTQQNGGLFPSDYSYVNGMGQKAANGNGAAADQGYYHWTAALDYTMYSGPVSGTVNADGMVASTYPKTAQQYVCPSSSTKGLAPTDFTTGQFGRIPQAPLGQTAQIGTIDDMQAPRISYLPNEQIMPRKKYCDTYDGLYYAVNGNYTTGFGTGVYAKTPMTVPASAPAAYQGMVATAVNSGLLCQVNIDEIDNPANTILLAEMTDSLTDIYGASAGGGTAFKTHRPVNALKVGPSVGSSATCAIPSYADTIDPLCGAGGPAFSTVQATSTIFDGELYPLFQAAPGQSNIFKLTSQEAFNAIQNVTNWDGTDTVGGTGGVGISGDPVANPHITYMNPDRHQGGSNYYFVDGHAAKLTLGATLDPVNWMWGSHVWSCIDKPLVRDN